MPLIPPSLTGFEVHNGVFSGRFPATQRYRLCSDTYADHCPVYSWLTAIRSGTRITRWAGGQIKIDFYHQSASWLTSSTSLQVRMRKRRSQLRVSLIKSTDQLCSVLLASALDYEWAGAVSLCSESGASAGSKYDTPAYDARSGPCCAVFEKAY